MRKERNPTIVAIDVYKRQDHLQSAMENGFNPISAQCQVIIGDGLKGTDYRVLQSVRKGLAPRPVSYTHLIDISSQMCLVGSFIFGKACITINTVCTVLCFYTTDAFIK